jgi:hypothetical protein
MSCAAGTSGVFRRIGLLAGAVAFLLQMFVWSIQAPAVAAGSLIPVCTVDGITLVDLNPDAQNPDQGRSVLITIAELVVVSNSSGYGWYASEGSIATK